MPFRSVGPRAALGAVLALFMSGSTLAQSPPVAPAPQAPAAAQVTLAEALERAQASPQITAAEATVRAAEARARQAGLRLNPQASLETEDFLGTGPFSALNGAQTTAAVGQTFELGGKRRARATAAQAEVEVARNQLGIARADLTADVRTRFAEVVSAREQVTLARQADERALELARLAATLVEAGREPPLRAYQALTAAGEARAERTAAEARYATARRALSTLWGEQDAAFEVVGAPETARPQALLAPDHTLEVRLAEAELAAARARIDVERSQRTPDVTVEGGVRRIHESGDMAFVAGVSAPIPIRNRNQGGIAAARSEAIAAEARRNLALAQSIRRARDAEADLAAAEARLSTIRELTLPQAEEALRLARLGFEAGRFTLLDVLSAQDAVAAARRQIVEAELARAQAVAALQRAAAR